LHVSTQTSKD